MCWSMYWNLWSKCWMLCIQSCSNVLLHSRIPRKCIYCLLKNTRYIIIPSLFKLKIFHNTLFEYILEPVVTNPCQPSPCGPNSQCREINKQAVCSCILGFIGSPPTCRPECVTSSECPLNEACFNQKCINPCPGTCGTGAMCQVVNHNPICTCPSRQTGDPFIRCIQISK